MKRFNAWILLGCLVLTWSQAAHSFELIGWRHTGPAVFYFNPSDLPDHYAEDDPRITALAGSPALQTAESIKIFEEELRARIHEWSSVPGSTLVARYGGRTDADCHNSVDGIFIICVLDDPAYFSSTGSVAAAKGASASLYGVATDAFVHFNAEFTYQSGMGTALLHELGHVFGLGHEDYKFENGGIAIMKSRLPVALFPLSLHRDDMAGIRYLYPFTEACAPVLDVGGGNPGFVAEVYFEGDVYQARFNYKEDDNLGYLVVVGIAENPVLARSCTLKFDGNDLLIPYIKFEDQMYELKLELNSERLTLDVVAVQSVA